MFAYDRGWTHRLEEAVLTGLTAEAAVERVQSDTRARMLRQTDPYLRERLHDLEDLAHRLMRQLMGQEHAPARESLPDNAIIVARSMGPAALLDYDRKKLRGLVLEEGGPTSHVAIVARAHRDRCRRRNRQRHRRRRSRRRHHRRRHHRRGPPAAVRRHGSGLRGARAAARAPAAAISGAARPPLRDQGRRDCHADAQCRSGGRPSAHHRDRRRGHRPVSHRAPVHGRLVDAAR